MIVGKFSSIVDPMVGITGSGAGGNPVVEKAWF